MHRDWSQSGNKRRCKSRRVTPSRSWWLYAEVPAKRTSTRERHRRGGQSFCGLPSNWRATLSGTGVHRRDTARVTTGDTFTTPPGENRGSFFGSSKHTSWSRTPGATLLVTIKIKIRSKKAFTARSYASAFEGKNWPALYLCCPGFFNECQGCNSA